MARIASATLRPCETRTPACRSLATTSSGLCLLLAISVLLRLEAIHQDGPHQDGPLSVIAGGGSSRAAVCSAPRRWGEAAVETPREAAMVRYAALDVSLEMTAICVVDEDGRVI